MRLCKCGCGNPIPNHFMKSKEYIHGHNPKPTYNLKRPCLCGCGGLIRDNAISRYIRGHAPKQHKPTFKLGRICACGCGKIISDKANSNYYNNHLTELYDKMECGYCLCGCGNKVSHPANKYYKDHSRYDKDLLEKNRLNSIEYWKDPDRRKARSKLMKNIMSDPSLIDQIKKSNEARYKSPEFSKEMSDRAKAMWEDPKHRDHLTSLHKDPEWKKFHSRRLKAGWTYEKRKEASMRFIELYKDPIMKKKISNGVKSFWNTSEGKKIMKRISNDPLLKKFRSKMMKKKWEDPEYKQAAIDRWNDPEFLAKNSGPNHYNWKGDASSNPYCREFIEPYKEEIREWDGFECRNPYCWGTAERLAIHHIDYDKLNCHFMNLISVCISCNSRANYHTKYWERLYNRIRLCDINDGWDYVMNDRCMCEFGA